MSDIGQSFSKCLERFNEQAVQRQYRKPALALSSKPWFIVCDQKLNRARETASNPVLENRYGGGPVFRLIEIEFLPLIGVRFRCNVHQSDTSIAVACVQSLFLCRVTPVFPAMPPAIDELMRRDLIHFIDCLLEGIWRHSFLGENRVKD